MSTLRRWGDELAERTKRQLRIDGFDASGQTARSIKHKTKQTGKILSTEITSRKLYRGDTTVIQALDQGVRLRPGRVANMSFIKAWMKDKNIRPKGKGGRFVSPTETNMRRSAFLIARSIGKLGTIKRFKYRGSSFMDLVFIPVFPKITQDVDDSMAYDIQQEINKNIPKENLK